MDCAVWFSTLNRLGAFFRQAIRIHRVIRIGLRVRSAELRIRATLDEKGQQSRKGSRKTRELTASKTILPPPRPPRPEVNAFRFLSGSLRACP